MTLAAIFLAAVYVLIAAANAFEGHPVVAFFNSLAALAWAYYVRVLTRRPADKGGAS
jgi:hypothetical protein